MTVTALLAVILVGGVAVFVNTLAVLFIMDLLRHSEILYIAVGFIFAAGLIGIDILGVLALWNRIRRYIAPMIR